MTHDDLSHCKKLGQIHICDKQRVVKKSAADSCIYSLYLSDHQQADHLCRVSVTKRDQDVAIAIGPNRFAYYTLHPSTYFFRCQNGSNSQTIQLTGISEIQVPALICVPRTPISVNLSPRAPQLEQNIAYGLDPLIFIYKNTKIFFKKIS